MSLRGVIDFLEKVDAMTIGEKLLVTKGAHGDVHLQAIPMAAETLNIDGKNRTEGGTFESSAVGEKAQVEDVWCQDDDSSTDCGDFMPEPEEKPKKAKRDKRIVYEANFDDEEVAVAYSQAQTFTAFVHSDDDDA